jgi:predicted YcjX-like family ATPase
MRWLKRRMRVGVVGLYQAGKSVFMTSMINHLRQHDPARLAVGDGRVKLDWVADLPPRDAIDRFNYERNRNRLGGRQWPDKTLGVSEYHCLFVRSDEKHTRQDLSFTDIPGERLADMTMAGRSFAQWSDTILELLADTAEYRRHAAEYLALMNASSVKPEQLLLAYKRLLGNLIFDFLPVVTPSSFLIDPKGTYVEPQYVHNRDIEGMAKNRLAGVDAERQFAPLSAKLRTADTATAAAFSSRYSAYVRQIVNPLAHGFKECDQILVLIDVTMLMAGGVGMYNGNKQMLQHLLAYVNPGQGATTAVADSIFKTLTGGFVKASDLIRTLSRGAVRLSSVTQLGFIATKADKIHANDRTKLLHLLEDMTRDLVATARHMTNLKVGHFVCAAVNSTESLPDYPALQARLPGKNESPQKFLPSQVPAQWPESWEVGDYRFPNVVPWMPANRDAPPKHIELDRVWNFILGIS